MKIRVIEQNDKLLLDIDGNQKEIKKDSPINFQNIIDNAVRLKFDSKIDIEVPLSEDVQNKVIIDIIESIVINYNTKVDDYSKFKNELTESFKEFI